MPFLRFIAAVIIAAGNTVDAGAAVRVAVVIQTGVVDAVTTEYDAVLVAMVRVP